jgi:hypothetical protein
VLGERAGGDVGGASRRLWHDQAHRALLGTQRERGQGERTGQCAGSDQYMTTVHDLSQVMTLSFGMIDRRGLR